MRNSLVYRKEKHTDGNGYFLVFGLFVPGQEHLYLSSESIYMVVDEFLLCFSPVHSKERLELHCRLFNYYNQP